MPSHEVYKHLKLDGDKPEIRLLELLPDSINSPLRCKLLREELHTNLPSIALSYTWDTNAPLRDVEINNLAFPVRGNFYVALERLRGDTAPVRVWADAVCIDQECVLERNTQIPLMKDNYSRAKNVFIRLGKRTPATTIEVEALHFLASVHKDESWKLEDLQVLLPDTTEDEESKKLYRC